MRLSQRMNGDRDKIVATLESVGAMLKHEVEARAQKVVAIETASIGAPPVAGETFIAICGVQLERLSRLMSDSQNAFQRASSGEGTPDDLRRAYAALLDGFLSAREAFGSIDASRSFPQTQRECREFTRSTYEQVAAWPQDYATAAKAVRGARHTLTLRAEYDISALERVMAREANGPLGAAESGR